MFVCRLIGLNIQKELHVTKSFTLKSNSIYPLKYMPKKNTVDFYRHRCKFSINIIGQSEERKSSQRASQVCMSNEAKEIFFFLSFSAIFHPFFTIRYKENTINSNNCFTSIVSCFLLLLFLLLLLKSNPFFYTSTLSFSLFSHKEQKEEREHKMEFIT